MCLTEQACSDVCHIKVWFFSRGIFSFLHDDSLQHCREHLKLHSSCFIRVKRDESLNIYFLFCFYSRLFASCEREKKRTVYCLHWLKGFSVNIHNWSFLLHRCRTSSRPRRRLWPVTEPSQSTTWPCSPAWSTRKSCSPSATTGFKRVSSPISFASPPSVNSRAAKIGSVWVTVNTLSSF